MRIAVRKESLAGERRVAVLPESVKRLAAKRIDVSVEAGAGSRSFATDEEYLAAGARVDPSPEALLADADAVLQIHPPSIDEVWRLRHGSTLVSLLQPHKAQIGGELLRALAARSITAIAVDLIPRTTAAQTMDVLSSQATAAGYEAVLLSAAALPRFFPMLMTAAGTIAPARVLVLGAGVAGLQAIGTAKRLGAVVEAFDVRRTVKEQVESLGARFVEVETGEDGHAAGGYARELGENAKRKQAEAIARHVASADVVICTALVQGAACAPVLLTAEMVRSMRAGSVIVDVAAEAGQPGNCEATKPGETVVEHGVTIIGAGGLASRMCVQASQMYSRNMEKLVAHFTTDGVFRFDFDDEIVAGSVVTHRGEVVHPALRAFFWPSADARSA
jgi:H+-translocating NAD(P) transhydrogenase subunit alpha